MSHNLISAFMADVLAGLGVPLAGTVGAVGSSAWQRLMHKRVSTAREILMEEIALGGMSLHDIPEEDVASVTLRYMRSADEFLRWADLIASLRREELVLLGEIHQHNIMHRPFETPADVWTGVLPLLKERHGLGPDDADMIAAACLRTGLLRIEGGLMDIGHAYLPTPRLAEFMSLADVEGVIARDAN